MKIEVTINPAQAQAFQKQLDAIISRNYAADKVQQQILALLTKDIQTLKELSTNMAALDDAITQLQNDVTQDTAVETSAVTLIKGIPGLIATAVATAQAAGATPAQLQALTDLGTTLTANATALAAAVTTNTPAAAAKG